jgi:hypothetical protein
MEEQNKDPKVLGGRRHHKSAKRVSAKTIRRTLKRLGMRPKGRLVLKGGSEGGDDGVVVKGGNRHRRGGRSASASMSSSTKGKRSRRRSKRSLSIPGLGKLPF